MGLGGFLAFSKTLYYNFEKKIWEWIHVDPSHQNIEFFNKYMIWIVGFISFIIVVQRNLDKMSYFSMLCFFIYMSLIILVMI